MLCIRSANTRHRVKFCENRSNGCGDIAILRFSKMAAAAILDFQKFKFLPADTLERPNLRTPVKFHQDTAHPLLRYGEYSIFEDGGRPPSWICF